MTQHPSPVPASAIPAPENDAAAPRQPARGTVTSPPEYRELARDIFRELIEIDTTDSSGNTTEAAEAMAQRLREAGLPEADVRVLGPHPRKGNLVARLRGTGERRPLLLLAHLDVVDAQRDDWSVDPFTFLDRDGYFYGRGTTDDKAMAAIWTANLIRLAREGFAPGRDIILALTADEEGGEFNGAKWLLGEHRDLIDAEYGLNEGGYGRIKNGQRISHQVQASEKINLDLQLEAHGQGGHSSLPLPDNAIFRLAEGLRRLAGWEFPIELNEVTRAFFERMSALESGQTAADMRAVAGTPPDAEAAARLSAVPYYSALMRTTCVPTRLEAGTANNVLPPTARAVVNCRLLPGKSPAEVCQAVADALADDRITIRIVGEAKPSPASPLVPEVMEPIERITAELWPGVPVVPVMGIGATDSLYFRQAGIPVYGVSGLFLDVDDVRAHARDERISVQTFFEGQEFLYRLVKTLSPRD